MCFSLLDPITSLILNPATFYLSSGTKQWNWAVGYMGVKGIDFDYVSMIFQLDFGIVSLMWYFWFFFSTYSHITICLPVLHQWRYSTTTIHYLLVYYQWHTCIPPYIYCCKFCRSLHTLVFSFVYIYTVVFVVYMDIYHDNWFFCPFI